MGEASFDMSHEERAELIKEFLVESDQHLRVLNEKLLQTEEAIKKDVEMSDDDLNAMFRAAHTIKGTASFIGLTKVVRLTHEMETILQRVKNREIKLAAKIIDVLFLGFDTLEALCQSLRDTSDEKTDIEEGVRRIHAVLEENTAKNTPPPAAELKPPEAEKKAASVSLNRNVDAKYLPQYVAETEQNIEDFNDRMVTLEHKAAADAKDVINELFRITHTIKGSSGVVNATDIAAVAHSIENILAFFRERHEVPNSEIISLLFEGIDRIKDMLQALKHKGDPAGDPTVVLKKLEECRRQIVQAQAESGEKGEAPSLCKQYNAEEMVALESLSAAQQKNLAESVGRDLDAFKIVLIIQQSTPLKGMKAFLLQEKLSREGSIISLKPSVDEIEKMENAAVTVGVIFCSSRNEKEVRFIAAADGLQFVSIERIEKDSLKLSGQEKDIKDAPPLAQEKNEGEKEMNNTPEEVKESSSPKTATVEISTVRVDSEKLDNLMNLSGELVIVRAQFARMVRLLAENILQQREIIQLIEKVKTAYEGFSLVTKNCLTTNQGNTAEVSKILKESDEIHNFVMDLEAKITKSVLINRIHALDEITGALGKISSDIQSGVMQTRMIPIEGVFTRFKRIVRDIAKELDKEINLTIIGEETELDKKIVDSLGDPLTHMIRNAVDHGIEDRATRQKLGKPEIGNITLKASHRGNNICIEVLDDGRGLDANKLVQKAIEKRLITDEQANAMTQKEKLELIFLPGFSTAEKVTGLSGRGVGMDVVKNMIVSVNGTMDIDTEVGRGTTFTLKIPLTLAIIQALLVVIGDVTYAIPIEAVIEIVKVSSNEIYSIDGNPTVKIREHALSLVELESIIKLRGQTRDKAAAKRMVIITDGEHQLGIVVDTLIGEDEIVIKSLSDHFANVRGVSGASILGDGQVALILDPAAIIKESK